MRYAPAEPTGRPAVPQQGISRRSRPWSWTGQCPGTPAHSRNALLEAAIGRWEKETTTDVVAEITAARHAPASQFRRLVASVIERAEQDRVGPALLASANHPAVAAALERITAARLSLIATVLQRLGFPPSEARRRALLAYSAYLGHGQLAHSTPAVLPATSAGRRAYLNDAIRALTTR